MLSLFAFRLSATHNSLFSCGSYLSRGVRLGSAGWHSFTCPEHNIESFITSACLYLTRSWQH